MEQTLKVGVIGFTDKNRTKLSEIFEVSRNTKRTYSISGTPEESDLFIVGVSDPDSFDRRVVIPAPSAHKPVITQGMSDKPPGADYHIKGLLLASRVINVLEQVELPPERISHLSIVEKDVSPETDSIPAVEPKEAQYRVLVVDDSEIMRKTLEQELSAAPVSLSVDFAENGEQAVDKVKDHQYDFMFLDVMMPGIDGYEACARIREVPGMMKAPIIMLSGKTSPLDEVKGIMAGCTNYITKPICSEDFQKMLGRVMNWLADYRK